MKIAFLVYHDVIDDRVIKILDELKIDGYTKWEQVVGKFQGSQGHLGTRIFPGHNSVRLIPFRDEEVLQKLIDELQDFNKSAVKKDDEIRLYLLPLEKIV
jgi:hypothetical protein